ncbi:MAG: 1-acyl-sn-glycerol-3-phosphate acyltransferase [Clostridia bacterium]|nr:1-acyl-sn-glycerol-3-phosphate acyltransferase [Clostridia bacterium]
MKIKSKALAYEKVLKLPPKPHKRPKKPNLLFRTLMRVLSEHDLAATHFKAKRIGMERLGKREPCLYLMNHSAFIDLKIASKLLYPRPYNIVCTSDGFVGKSWLMRNLGCTPTQKFVPDLSLIRDMMYSLKNLKCSVLMYPEAGYSFDGTATLLPETLGKCIKMLGAPVVMIRTCGAFSRDPLYNNLQLRKVNVSAEMEYLLSPDEIKEKSAEEINEILHAQFSFDSFRWQKENHVHLTEGFRADGLGRVLYKCPHCKSEGNMRGHDTLLECGACGKVYELTELGEMKAKDGATEFSHIPSWYAWQREEVKKEIINKQYRMQTHVEIGMLVDTKALYMIGEGHLTHDVLGFHLTGCGGKLDYKQSPVASYSLNADYNWYEIGDVISIGNHSALYYCFPKEDTTSVTKARLATEEMYKLYSRAAKHAEKEIRKS